MLLLLGKMVFDGNAIRTLRPDDDISPDKPFSVFQRAIPTHTFWTVGMPNSDPLMREFLLSYRACVFVDHETLVITSNTDGWHEIAQKLSDSDNKHVRQFATLLVQTFPQIFEGLKRTLKSDGTLAIRRYGT